MSRVVESCVGSGGPVMIIMRAKQESCFWSGEGFNSPNRRQKVWAPWQKCCLRMHRALSGIWKETSMVRGLSNGKVPDFALTYPSWTPPFLLLVRLARSFCHFINK